LKPHGRHNQSHCGGVECGLPGLGWAIFVLCLAGNRTLVLVEGSYEELLCSLEYTGERGQRNSKLREGRSDHHMQILPERRPESDFPVLESSQCLDLLRID
jgi:hypothetical protein